MSNLRRRDIIAGIRAAVAVIVLIASVSVAHSLIDLPGIVAIAVGGLIGYILSSVILRYMVPSVPSISDAERIQLKIGRRWIIWTIVMTLFFHFAAPLSWTLGCGLAAVTGLLGWAMERRKGAYARTRPVDRS